MNRIAKELKDEKVGGLAFFLSFIVLGIVSIINSYNFYKLFFHSITWTEWRFFLVGLLLGGLIAKRFMGGWTNVFLHELRHALLSNFVGNKWKGLVVNKESGHFEYAYSAKTARFNAFVALAPYWLPMFTILGGLVSYAAAYNHPHILILLVSLFYGIDLVLNSRDVSPVQTDITGIKGGYAIGFTYILIVNLFLFTIVASWIAGGGFEGVKLLFLELWKLFLHLVMGK